MPTLNVSDLNIVLGVLGKYILAKNLGFTCQDAKRLLTCAQVPSQFCTVSFRSRSSRLGILEKPVSTPFSALVSKSQLNMFFFSPRRRRWDYSWSCISKIPRK